MSWSKATLSDGVAPLETQRFYSDAGASSVEFVPAIDAVFERLGKKREDYIDLWPCEPMYFFRTPEGTYLDIAKDINEKYKFIKSCSLEDAEDWLKYCDC